MAKKGIESDFIPGWSPKQIAKMQQEVDKTEPDRLHKKELSKQENEKYFNERDVEKIFNEGATYSNYDKVSLRQAEHIHSRQTPAGSSLEHGKGKDKIKTGDYRRVG